MNAPLNLSFKQYRKTALTKARLLTQKDYLDFKGVIQTKEGPASFVAGDFLAVGIDGEQWPIQTTTMSETKIRVTEEDESGWADYANTNTVWATQPSAEFAVEISTGDVIYGKAGDYLVVSGSRKWIVDRDIFEKTYQEVE